MGEESLYPKIIREKVENIDIKEMLKQQNLTQTWLISQLSKYGIYVTKTFLSRILAHEVQGKKAVDIIHASYYIVNDYIKRMEK